MIDSFIQDANKNYNCNENICAVGMWFYFYGIDLYNENQWAILKNNSFQFLDIKKFDKPINEEDFCLKKVPINKICGTTHGLYEKADTFFDALLRLKRVSVNVLNDIQNVNRTMDSFIQPGMKYIQKRINEINKNETWNAIKLLKHDGKYYIYNGNHRCIMLKCLWLLSVNEEYDKTPYPRICYINAYVKEI